MKFKLLSILSAITQKDIERNNKYKKAIDILLSKEDSE